MEAKYLTHSEPSTVGLEAYYKLWSPQITNTSIHDYEGGNTGTWSGTLSTPTQNNGIIFDGVEDKITVPANPSIDANGKTELSISAWINPSSDGEGDLGHILSKLNIGVTVGYFFFVLEEVGGMMKLRAPIQHVTTDAVAQTGRNVPIDTWTNVAFVYNEDSVKKIKIYLNGSLQSLEVDTAGVGNISDDSAEELHIGNCEAGDRAFDGTIGEVRIYSQALSVERIRSEYELTRGRYGV